MSITEAHVEVKADKGSFDTVMDFLRNHLERAGCPPAMMMKIELAVEEVFINVASYAYGNSDVERGTDTVTVSCLTDDENHEVDITFIDHGTPYDPLAKDDPDISAPVEQRQIGGLGIFLVKNIMDEVEYSYDEPENRLIIRKGWDV